MHTTTASSAASGRHPYCHNFTSIVILQCAIHTIWSTSLHHHALTTSSSRHHPNRLSVIFTVPMLSTPSQRPPHNLNVIQIASMPSMLSQCHPRRYRGFTVSPPSTPTPRHPYRRNVIHIMSTSSTPSRCHSHRLDVMSRHHHFIHTLSKSGTPFQRHPHHLDVIHTATVSATPSQCRSSMLSLRHHVAPPIPCVAPPTSVAPPTMRGSTRARLLACTHAPTWLHQPVVTYINFQMAMFQY